MKRSYSTDLTDAEWQCLEPHVLAPSKFGTMARNRAAFPYISRQSMDPLLLAARFSRSSVCVFRVETHRWLESNHASLGAGEEETPAGK